MTEQSAGSLSPVAQRFILHWGQMGTRWGVNRTVAQVHALLYISPTPLTAEEIAQTLSVARSNVSTSLRELQSWGLVNIVHVLGDRRDHFETVNDVWQMFQVIVEERKRREIDPTLTMLRECLAALENEGATDTYARAQLHEMLEFFEATTAWYDEMRHLPISGLRRLLKLGDTVGTMLGLPGSEAPKEDEP